MTPQEIAGNCAAGDSCRCLKKAKPWLCDNWGRSSLPCPGIVSAYHNTMGQEAKVLGIYNQRLKERREKEHEWNIKSEENLRRIRHQPPGKQLDRLKARGAKLRQGREGFLGPAPTAAPGMKPKYRT
jgi:hypothetical protein